MLLAYVMVELLTRVARDSGQSPAFTCSIQISATGELDEGAGEVLQHALDHVTMDEHDLLLDLHAVAAMNVDGLLHLLSLHRRDEACAYGCWSPAGNPSPQPQQCMATVAGIPGPRAATGERYALAGFRRLLEEKAQRARERSDFADGRLPRVQQNPGVAAARRGAACPPVRRVLQGRGPTPRGRRLAIPRSRGR